MANAPITPKEKLAWEFAQRAHKDQVRKFTGLPYFDNHVQKVNGTLKLYTTDEATLIAALLHDVIEDCYENKWDAYNDIKDLFGQEVADLVMELTSDNEEMKHKWGGSKVNYLINKMLKMSDKAFTIKLSDRFNNIADAFTASERFRTNYYRETCAIVDAMEEGRTFTRVQRQLLDDIKAKLDNIKRIFKVKKLNEM
jgi:guanosine-3',5'-bis(diphosphate) 3'-pyrophosphohydrolase